jgi:hypothetical protein
MNPIERVHSILRTELSGAPRLTARGVDAGRSILGGAARAAHQAQELGRHIVAAVLASSLEDEQIAAWGVTEEASPVAGVATGCPTDHAEEPAEREDSPDPDKLRKLFEESEGERALLLSAAELRAAEILDEARAVAAVTYVRASQDVIMTLSASAEHDDERHQVVPPPQPPHESLREGNGRPRRVAIASMVAAVLAVSGTAVWALAGNSATTSDVTPRIAGTNVVTPAATLEEPTTTSLSTTLAPVPADSKSTVDVVPSATFDADAFMSTWRAGAATLAPIPLTAKQAQELRRPVPEGSVFDAQALTTQLKRGWKGGYGVFFVPTGSSQGTVSGATAVAYRYSSGSDSSSAYGAAKDAYASDTSAGPARTEIDIPQPAAARQFMVATVQNDTRSLLSYLEYPGVLIQVSVNGATDSATDTTAAAMITTIEQWAVAAGFEATAAS